MSSSDVLTHRRKPVESRDSSPASSVDESPYYAVDYVVKFRYLDDASKAEAAFSRLIESMRSVGFLCQVRPGGDDYFLILTRLDSFNRLQFELYKSRLREWVHEARDVAPPLDSEQMLLSDPLYESEELRIIHNLITLPQSEGGAGVEVSPAGKDGHVESIFPLHDRAANRSFLRRCTKKRFLNRTDLNDIRNRFGESVAFYFAFAQTYFSFLLFPAVIGIFAFFFFETFSPVYALLNGLWCIVFTEYWKCYETDLATTWNVRGVSKLFRPRKGFVPVEVAAQSQTSDDPPSLFPVRRLCRQLLQVPFTFITSATLGFVIAGCFGIEILISEVYAGPFQRALVFLPTVLLTVLLPLVRKLAYCAANFLTKYENYETEVDHETSLIRKMFVVDFIVSYLPITLTAFVYIPFAQLIVPYLDVFSLTTRNIVIPEKDGIVQDHISAPLQFQINPDRLRTQVFYFTVTAQILHLVTSFVLPYLQDKGIQKFKSLKHESSEKSPVQAENREEAKFLEHVRTQACLETYNVTDDFREMVIQFGYLSLFSVVWPLTAFSFVLRDWIELRADAAKICERMKRPIPHQSETIGPWVEFIGLIGWFGSITTSALVYMYSNGGIGSYETGFSVSAWKLAMVVILVEHGYLLVSGVVGSVISQLDFPGRRALRVNMKKKEYDLLSLKKRSDDADPRSAHELLPDNADPWSAPVKENLSPVSASASSTDVAVHGRSGRIDISQCSPAVQQFWGLRDSSAMASAPSRSCLDDGFTLIEEHFRSKK